MPVTFNGETLDFIPADPSTSAFKRAADFIKSRSDCKPTHILIDKRTPIQILDSCEDIPLLLGVQVSPQDAPGFVIRGDFGEYLESIE